VKSYTPEELDAIGQKLADRFNLKRDPEHKDRWRTGWGTKTNYGLAVTFLEMARRINEGEEQTI